MTDPCLFSDGGLPEPEVTEGSHVLVVSSALLSVGLTQRNGLCKHIRRLGHLPSQEGRGSCWFCLTVPVRGEMTCQHALQSLTTVCEQMEPICRWRGSWNRFPGGSSVVSSSISTEQRHVWVGRHPVGARVNPPLGKPIEPLVWLEIQQDCRERAPPSEPAISNADR